MSIETTPTNATKYRELLANEGISSTELVRAQKIAQALADHSSGWTTPEEFGAAVEAYTAADLHLVLCYPANWPNSRKAKAPIAAEDCLTEDERASDRWRGKNAVHLATNDTAELAAMAHTFIETATARYGATALPNLGVHTGKSGLVVADADTPDTVKALVRALNTGDPDERAQFGGSPTVRTPGKIDQQGNQVHKDGGHWYFVATDDSIPNGDVDIPGTTEKWSVITGNKMVLLPGSRRTEGTYRAADNPHVGIAGPWLAAAQRGASTAAPTGPKPSGTASYTSTSTEGESPLDRWTAAHTWHDILIAQGWTPKGTSSCGDDCRVWEHPTASSGRSATAHGTGCTEFDADPHSGSYPLHMWSGSHPQIDSDTTISKAQFVCTTVYGDNWAQFFKGEDVDSYGQDILDAERAEAERLLVGLNTPAPKAEQPVQPADAPETNEPTAVEQGAPAAGQSLAHAGIDAELITEAEFGVTAQPEANEVTSPPEPPVTDIDAIIAETLAKYPATDLVALMATPPPPPDWLEERLFARGEYYGITAAAKAGKSLLAYWMVGHWALGRSALDETRTFEPLKVLYLDFENGREWLHTQLTAMGFPPAINDNLKVVQFPSLPFLNTKEGGTELIKLIAAYRPDVIVFDTVSRFVSGDENSSSLWSDFYNHSIMPIRRALPDAVIIRLDHTGKDETKGARGSSQKMSDITTHWVLTSEESDSNALALTLERSRMSSHAEKVLLRRVDTPALGHVYRNGKGGLGPVMFGDAIAIAAEADDINLALDELGADDRISNRNAAQLLRDNGKAFSTERLSTALQRRKERADYTTETAAGSDQTP
jgi:hypothetical protein